MTTPTTPARTPARPDPSPRPTRPGRAGRRGRGERGSATAQMVVLTPLIVFLLLLPFQVAIWMHARQLAGAAADLGAFTASANRPDAEAAGARAAEGMLAHTAATIEQVSLTRSERTVTATVSVRMDSLIPGRPLHVSTSRQFALEQFVQAPHG